MTGQQAVNYRVKKDLREVNCGRCKTRLSSLLASDCRGWRVTQSFMSYWAWCDPWSDSSSLPLWWTGLYIDVGKAIIPIHIIGIIGVVSGGLGSGPPSAGMFRPAAPDWFLDSWCGGLGFGHSHWDRTPQGKLLGEPSLSGLDTDCFSDCCREHEMGFGEAAWAGKPPYGHPRHCAPLHCDCHECFPESACESDGARVYAVAERAADL